MATAARQAEPARRGQPTLGAERREPIAGAAWPPTSVLARAVDGAGTTAAGRLLAVATGLFYLEGIRAVGIDRLIDEAGVAKATFYAHYRSKQELVDVYLRSWDAAWMDWLAEWTGQRRRVVRSRLLGVFDGLAASVDEKDFRGCAFANATAELGPEADGVRSVAQAHKAAVRRHLAGLAREGGLQRPDELAARLVVLVDGAMAAAAREGSAEPAVQARAAADALISRSRSRKG